MTLGDGDDTHRLGMTKMARCDWRRRSSDVAESRRFSTISNELLRMRFLVVGGADADSARCACSLHFEGRVNCG